jgi:peptide/nickel transport system permease protein
MRHLSRYTRLFLAGPILVGLVALALFSEVLAPADPLKINAWAILKAPSADHLLGTDQLGRDLLSRVIYGARISLSVAAAAVTLATLIGVVLGLLAGYAGGWLENGIMRAVDAFLSIPEIFVAIVIMAFFTSNLTTLILTIGLLYFPQFARVIYAVTTTLKRKEFVEASVALGAGASRIIFREILPNIASIIVVQVTFTISFAMLLEAGLSFLGLGVMPPQPSWGQMVGDLKDYIQINPLLVIFPSAALFLAVFSVNTLGDWLQDWLNPEVAKD